MHNSICLTLTNPWSHIAHAQSTYSFLPWDGTLPVHQIHGPIWIFSGHCNESLGQITPEAEVVFLTTINTHHSRNRNHDNTLIQMMAHDCAPGFLRESRCVVLVEKNTNTYKRVVFSPRFALLGQSAQSNARHCSSLTPPCGKTNQNKLHAFV